jgi:hypothetical protein
MPPLPGAHLITKFVMPAVRFRWSVLLVVIAKFIVLCIALLDCNL